MSTPKIFISYSWTSTAHTERVKALADRLIGDGIHAILDQYDLKEGQDLNAFMEQMVNDQAVSKVLAICDKTYAEKANSRRGGVGTESQIISAEVYKQVDQNKFIALFFETSETGEPHLPTFFKSRFGIDMSTPEKEHERYEQLVRAIYNKPIHKRPTLGKIPSFLLEDEQQPVKTKHQLITIKEAIQHSRPHARSAIRDYFTQFSNILEDFRIHSLPREAPDEVVHSSISSFLHYRDNFIETIDYLSKYSNIDETTDDIHAFFEDSSRYLHRPPSLTSWNDEQFDNYRIILYELFIYTSATLIKNKKFHALNKILSQDYYVSTDREKARFSSYVHFHGFTETIQHIRSNSRQRVSATADLLKDQATSTITFDEIMQADFVLFIYSITHIDTCNMWFPFSLIFVGYGRTFPLFDKAESRRYFSDLKTILGHNNKEELIAAYENGNGQHNLRNTIGFRSAFTSINIRELANFDKLDSRG
ncbi:hypothetical protein D7X99_38505 [Corallococcus sp. AB032C]|uniref:SEFIR domain-containing protein n=1 Tax=Corallococcus TaxID=83461 RepID=UPI000EC1BB9E|nr:MULTISPECIES: SEFIR domain-containing protein [Corallococcus]NPC53487.1 TIR domain-containing protein [Corallococcus exiguus]RKH75358.1 hypothetical protein D7X99_38505 [Corallococcus sp. AB032C]